MLKRSDFLIKMTADGESIRLYLHANNSCMIYESKNISEIEKFIDYKIRESLKYPESASEFFSYSLSDRFISVNINDYSGIKIEDVFFVIFYKDDNQSHKIKDELLPRLLEWLEYHGINIELEAKQ